MLRGINVSGRKLIRMEDLRALFERSGFSRVKTYIQSGNVFFTGPPGTDETKLAKKIQQAIHDEYGFEIEVVIRSLPEMEEVLKGNPFREENDMGTEWFHVTFFRDFPDKEKIDPLLKLDFNPDRFMISGREAYLYCPNGYGRTKINNSFFENKLKVPATTRNWKTVIKLVELAAD